MFIGIEDIEILENGRKHCFSLNSSKEKVKQLKRLNFKIQIKLNSIIHIFQA